MPLVYIPQGCTYIPTQTHWFSIAGCDLKVLEARDPESRRQQQCSQASCTKVVLASSPSHA